MTSETSRCLEAHIASFWPGRGTDDLTWNLGPIRASLPNFRVRGLAPREEGDYWAYVTIGASETTESLGAGKEFLLLSPSETPRHIETLAMLAHFNSLPQHRLDFGEVIKIGRPWLEGSGCDWLYMSVPYTVPREFQYCTTPDGGGARFLWAVPVYASEAAYMRSSTAEAFERYLEQSNVDVLDPNRPVVGPVQ